MANARISTIIPVFNCEKYVGDAIASALEQSRPPDEIIVVDDGSTDASANEVGKFGATVHYTRQINMGIGAARNTGVALATGDYLAFLDADDLWTPQKLELQEAVLAKEPEIDMVFGLVTHFRSPDLDPAVVQRLYCPDEDLPGFGAPAMLTRRRAFDVVGRFNESLILGEFVDWYARALELNLKPISLDEVVLRRRIHGANTGVRARDSRQDYVRVMKNLLDRRRGMNESG